MELVAVRLLYCNQTTPTGTYGSSSPSRERSIQAEHWQQYAAGAAVAPPSPPTHTCTGLTTNDAHPLLTVCLRLPTDVVCSEVTPRCKSGEYEIMPPTASSDRTCEPCQICPPGQHRTSGCRQVKLVALGRRTAIASTVFAHQSFAFC